MYKCGHPGFIAFSKPVLEHCSASKISAQNKGNEIQIKTNQDMNDYL